MVRYIQAKILCNNLSLHLQEVQKTSTRTAGTSKHISVEYMKKTYLSTMTLMMISNDLCKYKLIEWGK